MLGHCKTKPALIKAGVTEPFFWNAFNVIYKDGNEASHSKRFMPITQSDFDIVSKAIIDIQAYLFYDYFKKYKFGSNEKVERYFSLLPPFFRLIVLHELLFLDFENVDVVHKMGLAAIKALGKTKALDYIKNEKDQLGSHPMPISSEEAKLVLEKHGISAYVLYLKTMNTSVYGYLMNLINNALLVEVLPVYRSSTVVWNDKGRRTPEKVECIRMSCIPGRHLLVKEPLTIEVSAIRKRHNEDMNIHQFTSVSVNKMAVVTSPVCLPLKTGNMIHREGDVILTTIFRYNLVEATQLVSVHALGFRFCAVLRPKLVPLIPLTLLLQDLLAVRLQIAQVYAFP